MIMTFSGVAEADCKYSVNRSDWRIPHMVGWFRASMSPCGWAGRRYAANQRRCETYRARYDAAASAPLRL